VKASFVSFYLSTAAGIAFAATEVIACFDNQKQAAKQSIFAARFY